MNWFSSRIVLRPMTIAALVSISLSTAFAADPPSNPPPDKGDRRSVAQACRADAERFCATVEKGGGRKMMCLRDHASQLSPACRTGLAEMAANRKDAPPK
jgi:hypothetical protein